MGGFATTRWAAPPLRGAFAARPVEPTPIGLGIGDRECPCWARGTAHGTAEACRCRTGGGAERPARRSRRSVVLAMQAATRGENLDFRPAEDQAFAGGEY